LPLSSRSSGTKARAPSFNQKQSMQKKKTPDGTAPLSQEELKAWWPFERLDPKRFPKQDPATKPCPISDVEDALL
jgi:hypothetical protein